MKGGISAMAVCTVYIKKRRERRKKHASGWRLPYFSRPSNRPTPSKFVNPARSLGVLLSHFPSQESLLEWDQLCAEWVDDGILDGEILGGEKENVRQERS